MSAALVAVALVASACSSGDSSGGGGDKTIRVAYQLFGTSDGVDRLMKRIKSDFEEETGYTLKLVPWVGSYNRGIVLEAIRLNEGASRAEIARRTGLTPHKRCRTSFAGCCRKAS